MQAPARVRAGIYLERFTAGLVQPGENDEFVSGAKAVETLSGKRMNFKPGIGRAFMALHGSALALFDRGADHADGAELGAVALLLRRHAASILSQRQSAGRLSLRA